MGHQIFNFLSMLPQFYIPLAQRFRAKSFSYKTYVNMYFFVIKYLAYFEVFVKVAFISNNILVCIFAQQKHFQGNSMLLFFQVVYTVVFYTTLTFFLFSLSISKIKPNFLLLLPYLLLTNLSKQDFTFKSGRPGMHFNIKR